MRDEDDPPRQKLLLTSLLIPPVIAVGLYIIGALNDCVFFATGGPDMCGDVMRGLPEAVSGILFGLSMLMTTLSFGTLPAALIIILMKIVDAARDRGQNR